MQACRDIPASTAYFAIYEHGMHFLLQLRPTNTHHVMDSFFCGGIAGVLSWMLIMPLDVVKNTYQAQNSKQSLGDCVRTIFKRGGIAGFYTGSSAAAMRAFPVNAITFLVYDMTMKLLQSDSS